jgi:hypothetical protein
MPDKFTTTKEEFLRPMRMRVVMDDIIAESLAEKGRSDEEINDLLQDLNEDND